MKTPNTTNKLTLYVNSDGYLCDIGTGDILRKATPEDNPPSGWVYSSNAVVPALKHLEHLCRRARELDDPVLNQILANLGMGKESDES